MKHESHCTTLDTKSTTRESTSCSGFADAMRLPISCSRSMSDLSVTSNSESVCATVMGSLATELVLIWVSAGRSVRRPCGGVEVGLSDDVLVLERIDVNRRRGSRGIRARRARQGVRCRSKIHTVLPSHKGGGP